MKPLLLAILLAAASLSAQSPAAQVRDLANRPVDPFDNPKTIRGTVLIFVSVECPVSNRYAPEIRRLYTAFASKGLRFWLVYPNRSDQNAAIRAHVKVYEYPPIALRDPAGSLVKLTGATVTPEAAVFDAKGSLIYRGRIDDRFVEPGKERPAATRHDFEAALQAAIDGKRVSPQTTEAFGCFIADFNNDP